ncbi:MAG: hypothetical protein Q4A01_02610 [Coriobacteriales bacterium]|nr:hypothetical protein [Coriobacteriales bacterium]
MTINSMTANEYVVKAINDNAFLVEICKFIPDEMLQEENPEESQNQPGGLGRLMAKYFWPAAQTLGGDFDEAEL